MCGLSGCGGWGGAWRVGGGGSGGRVLVSRLYLRGVCVMYVWWGGAEGRVWGECYVIFIFIYK